MKFAPVPGRRLLAVVTLLFLLPGGRPSSAHAEAMLQYFNVSWSELAQKMPELAEAGYNSLWLPPPTKASGGLSVGYDLWDPFDLGSKDQRNTVRTRYGTEAELLHLVKVAHRFGIRVYFDNIMNHRAFDVPGYDENTPIGGEGQAELYPGMVPEDFHLRTTEDGFYRKWDNTRDWGSTWQVQNLGLADLIDIAHETTPMRTTDRRKARPTRNIPLSAIWNVRSSTISIRRATPLTSVSSPIRRAANWARTLRPRRSASRPASTFSSTGRPLWRTWVLI
jgi:Glycosidases